MRKLLGGLSIAIAMIVVLGVGVRVYAGLRLPVYQENGKTLVGTLGTFAFSSAEAQASSDLKQGKVVGKTSNGSRIYLVQGYPDFLLVNEDGMYAMYVKEAGQ